MGYKPNVADKDSVELRQLKKPKTRKCSVRIFLSISFSGQQIHYNVIIRDMGMVASLDIYINEFPKHLISPLFRVLLFVYFYRVF